MAQNNDYNYIEDVPDPNAVEANIESADQNAVVKSVGFAQRNAAGQQAGANLLGEAFSKLTGDSSVGDPRVVQARKISTAMQSIIQEANAGADPNEDPISRQMRTANAVAAGMASISPQIAMKAAQQSVALEEARNQQNYLLANTARIKQVTEEDQTNDTLKKTKANYVTYGTTIDKKTGLPEYTQVGDAFQLYNPDGTQNPDFAKTVLANQQLAKTQGVQNPRYSTVDEFENNKANAAQIRAQAATNVQQQKDADKAATAAATANMDPQTLHYLAAQSALLGMAAIKSRGFTQAEMNAITADKVKAGLNPADEVMAQAEIQGLRSGERAIGTRAGNTTILQNELNGLAEQVNKTLDQVDRSRVPLINQMIKTGAVGGIKPGPEAAYAAALQAFTTAHGRLIAGATGVTSDSARDAAQALVTATMAPEGVKAALNQIVSKEVPIIRSASDEAIGIMANRSKYPGINKISSAFGYPIDNMVPGATHNSQEASPTAHPGQTAAATPKSKADYDALPSGTVYVAPDGTTKRKK